jgi:hypothetical protein
MDSNDNSVFLNSAVLAVDDGNNGVQRPRLLTDGYRKPGSCVGELGNALRP